MEETQLLKFTIIVVMISLVFINGGNSEVYTVGDDEEWSTGTNYLAWSQRYNFSVGDVLVFRYVSGQHDAYEVTETTYKSCNSSTGILAKYESGDDQVKLTEAKKYWFICTISGHCLGGMRFAIDVKAANSTSSSNHPNASPPQMEPNPPNAEKGCASGRRIGIGLGIYLVLLQILSL